MIEGGCSLHAAHRPALHHEPSMSAAVQKIFNTELAS